MSTSTDTVKAFRGRPFTVTVNFVQADGITGDDVSGFAPFTAELRVGPTPTDDEIATFAVDDTDADTGTLVLSLTDTQMGAIGADVLDGWFDVLGTGDQTMMDSPVRVEFADLPTEGAA